MAAAGSVASEGACGVTKARPAATHARRPRPHDHDDPSPPNTTRSIRPRGIGTSTAAQRSPC